MFSAITERHFVNAIVFHNFFLSSDYRIAFCVEDHKTNNCCQKPYAEKENTRVAEVTLRIVKVTKFFIRLR